MKKCDIKTLTRSLQRRINHLDKNITSHLPKFYGGIYSKIAKNSDEYYKELIAKSENWDEVMSELKFTTLQIFKNVKEHLDKLNINYSHLKKPTLFRTNSRYSLEEILIENSSYTNMIHLKTRLIKEYDWKYECSGCNKSTCGDCNYKLRFNNLGKKIDERPSLETLNRDIAELKNFSAVGRKHNVCDNTIRKWIKYYNKYA